MRFRVLASLCTLPMLVACASQTQPGDGAKTAVYPDSEAARASDNWYCEAEESGRWTCGDLSYEAPTEDDPSAHYASSSFQPRSRIVGLYGDDPVPLKPFKPVETGVSVTGAGTGVVAPRQSIVASPAPVAPLTRPAQLPSESAQRLASLLDREPEGEGLWSDDDEPARIEKVSAPPPVSRPRAPAAPEVRPSSGWIEPESFYAQLIALRSLDQVIASWRQLPADSGRVYRTRTGDGDWYAILLGPYADAQQALNMGQALRLEGDPWVRSGRSLQQVVQDCPRCPD